MAGVGGTIGSGAEPAGESITPASQSEREPPIDARARG